MLKKVIAKRYKSGKNGIVGYSNYRTLEAVRTQEITTKEAIILYNNAGMQKSEILKDCKKFINLLV